MTHSLPRLFAGFGGDVQKLGAGGKSNSPARQSRVRSFRFCRESEMSAATIVPNTWRATLTTRDKRRTDFTARPTRLNALKRLSQHVRNETQRQLCAPLSAEQDPIPECSEHLRWWRRDRHCCAIDPSFVFKYQSSQCRVLFIAAVSDVARGLPRLVVPTVGSVWFDFAHSERRPVEGWSATRRARNSGHQRPLNPQRRITEGEQLPIVIAKEGG
ncbi:hypothetical protein SAMN05216525_15825 [Bradyrhizobium sp. Gha]|nr:hypothetical protein SAMN05216525_15825 [Bradyrhizobium sp. Gha]